MGLITTADNMITIWNLIGIVKGHYIPGHTDLYMIPKKVIIVRFNAHVGHVIYR